MDYLCSECSIELSKFEIQLNREFPIGKLYCSFCQYKKEREIIQRLAKSEADSFSIFMILRNSYFKLLNKSSGNSI